MEKILLSLGLLLGRVAFSYDVYSCPTLFDSGTSECLVDYDLGTSVLRLTSNGLPGHWYDPAGGAAEQLWEQDFPLRPAITFRPSGGIAVQPGQLVGFATNGVPYRLADPSNPAFTGADGCLGMVDSQTRAYYYTMMPPCLARGPARAGEQGKEPFHDRHHFTLNSVLDAFAADRGGLPSPIIGYALDGFPILGPFDSTGALHSGLDTCNGKIVNGSYAYYATIEYPYLLGCFGPGPIEDERQTSPPLDYSLASSDRAECPVGMFQSSLTNGCELCPAGSFGQTNGLTSSACSGKCPKGYYCPPGSSSPTTLKCPAGRYGSEEGMPSAACSGPCEAGYFCPEGSTSPTQVPCAGTSFFCPGGSADRIAVTDGYYTTSTAPIAGDSTHPSARNNRQSHFHRTNQVICERGHYCVAGAKFKCPPGVYGSTPGLTSALCTAACPKGHYCPEGSPLPQECPAGTYGASPGLTSAACSGLASPGYFCPAASTSPTQMACPPGRYGASPGLTTDACSINCDNNTGSCVDAVCSPGYYCPEASSSATQVQCGGADVFCPYGSVLPTPVDVGYYTIGPSSSPGSYQEDADKLVRTAQVICEPGTYCIAGTRYPCAAGKYGSTSGLSTSDCSGPCDAGYFCPEQSTSSRQRDCGGPHLYCPGGEGKPRKVAKGNYSIGITAMTLNNETYHGQLISGAKVPDRGLWWTAYSTEGEVPQDYSSFHRGRGVLGEIGQDLTDVGAAANRVAQSICPPGTYCENGIARLCPAGTYGFAYGTATPECAGKAWPGYYCLAGSTRGKQMICPAGRWGTEGMGTEQCEGECAAGYFCPAGSTSPTQHECGGETVYCPPSSPFPRNVSTGYYATGGAVRTRTGQALCRAHTPPAGEKRANICPSTTMPLGGPATFYDSKIESNEYGRDVNEQGAELH